MSRARLLLFALVWLSCVWFGTWALNPNNSTRMIAAISLVDGQSGRIDDYQALTIANAQFGGHVYLDKAPGMTLLAVAAVAVSEHLSARPPIPNMVWDPPFDHWMTLRLRLAVATVRAILAALAALALYDLALRTTGSARGALFAAIAFALGTPVWGWSTTLFGHAPVALPEVRKARSYSASAASAARIAL